MLDDVFNKFNIKSLIILILKKVKPSINATTIIYIFKIKIENKFLIKL